MVPVVNENDVVATEEIKFGDNDTLSAVVAGLIDADLLILLTDIEGLFTADPRHDPAATLIREVLVVTPVVEALAGGSGSAHGTGGMVTKLRAARLATEAGIPMIIADGRSPGAIAARHLPASPAPASCLAPADWTRGAAGCARTWVGEAAWWWTTGLPRRSAGRGAACWRRGW